VHGPPPRKNYRAKDPGPGLLPFLAAELKRFLLISVDFKSSLVADLGGKVSQIHSILC
jgi:hypothetical protein